MTAYFVLVALALAFLGGCHLPFYRVQPVCGALAILCAVVAAVIILVGRGVID